ncbi:phage tail protein [Ligilactobacillus salivarius]|uniref:phage tail protein n=1 Tax=Ligilactobacillus salivarius TaxID=1624 RepID=UPI001F514E43|nr:phage tail protein [Ligilactobacillus salivarius]
MWKYDVNGGDKIYSVNDVLAFYLDGNKNGFSYQVIGDFDKQQITDLGNTNGKDMISKILSTWENAIFYPDNRNIRIYNKKDFYQNKGKRLDYLHNTSEVQLNIDSTGIVNKIRAIGTEHEVTTTKEITVTDSNGDSWGWPFPDVGEGNFTGGQLFGVNAGGEFRPNGFHDGLDFGSVDHPGSAVHAVHGGKVIIKSYMDGLGNYVVISGGGYNVVYQEAFSSADKITVNVGDTVKTGDVIGYRDTDHLHVGVTRQDFNIAVGKSFTNDGTWLNPLDLIKSGDTGPTTHTETEEENHTEKYFDDFIVEDKDSIAKWGEHPAADMSDDRFHDKNAMEAYVRSKFQLEPLISGTANESSNIKPDIGEIRRLEVKPVKLVTEVMIVGFTWYPFDSTQQTQLTLNNLPYSVLRNNINILQKINEISTSVTKTISKLNGGNTQELEETLKKYIDDKLNNNTPTNPDTPNPQPQHIGKIIDVSEWQGVIDWPSVIADDVTLSIIRIQDGSTHQDLKYMENIQKCISAGGKYAVYAYFAATSTSDAQQEARDFYNRTQQVVAGKQQPIFYAIDVESIEMSGDVTQMRAGVEAYMSQLNALGVPDNKIVLYIANHLYDKFNLNVARPGAIWIPSYGQNDGTLANSLKPTHPYDLHQFTSKGSVKGISGNVDMSAEPSEKFKELIFSA